MTRFLIKDVVTAGLRLEVDITRGHLLISTKLTLGRSIYSGNSMCDMVWGYRCLLFDSQSRSGDYAT